MNHYTFPRARRHDKALLQALYRLGDARLDARKEYHVSKLGVLALKQGS